MPRNYRSRRRIYRKRARVAVMGVFKKGVGRVGSTRWAKRTKRGFLSIVRKARLITVSNSSVNGVAQLTDPTGSCLTLGVPTLSPGFGADVYDIPFAMRFRLDQLVNSGDITALADQYKILGAYVRIFYNVNGSTGQTGRSIQSLPFVQSVTDHDDASIPDVILLRQKMGLKFKTFRDNSGYIGLMCRPVPSTEIYTTTGTGYAVPGRSPWLNSTDDTIPHYGIKGILCQVPLAVISSTNGQNVFTFDVAMKVIAKDFQ